MPLKIKVPSNHNLLLSSVNCIEDENKFCNILILPKIIRYSHCYFYYLPFLKDGKSPLDEIGILKRGRVKRYVEVGGLKTLYHNYTKIHLVFYRRSERYIG